MGQIPANQVRGSFTQAAIARYQDFAQPTSFLKSFFPSRVKSTRFLSIEVQRGTEKVAVDVVRGADGNRNSFSKSTEKIFSPPIYNEYFDMTELDLYDNLFNNQGTIDSGVFRDLTAQAADKMLLIKQKIDRSIELQCAQALNTGIITFQNNDSVDFKRKAGSLVALTGGAWDNNSTDIAAQIQEGCVWLRKNGKAQGGRFNLIMGEGVYEAMLNNTKFQASGDIRRMDLMNIRMPQRDSTGAVSHGEIAAGDYNVTLWTYPEYYDNSSGVQTPYMNPKTIVLLPENPSFVTGFAAVPRLMGDGGSMGIATTQGEFVFGEYTDPRKKAHIMEVLSAPLAIPVGIDQIYTRVVLA